MNIKSWTCWILLVTALVLLFAIAPAATESGSVRRIASRKSGQISDESLEKLAKVVEGYIRQDELTGAELLIIQDRKPILHKAFGWRDRDSKTPMEQDTLFNVRSMTKPLLGTAIQILVEEGRLRRDDPVSRHLPEFDNDQGRLITIEQLLTHRSGLPLMLPLELKPGESAVKVLWKYKDQSEIIQAIAQRGPDSKPGDFFQYSDAGAEVLGALIARITGNSLEEFFRARIFKPLKMVDAMIPFRSNDPRAARVAAAYTGAAGHWLAYWRNHDPGLYPFAMASQSLYCTPMDYARFLRLWLEEGSLENARLLSSQTVRRALRPISEMQDYATGFPGMTVWYGEMWMVYVSGSPKIDERPAIFGHGGSDGTMAWVWPGQDLMILLFTQNRGLRVAHAFEREIDDIIFNPSPEEISPARLKTFDRCTGTFALKDQPSELFTVTRQEGKLRVLTPRGSVVELLSPDRDGIWRFSSFPIQGILFSEAVPDRAMHMWIVDRLHLRKIDPGASGAATQAAPELGEYIGSYVLAAGGDRKAPVFSFVPEGNSLLIEAKGGDRNKLKLPDRQGRWYLTERPGDYVVFERNPEGKVVGCTAFQMQECERTIQRPPSTRTEQEAQKNDRIATYLREKMVGQGEDHE